MNSLLVHLVALTAIILPFAAKPARKNTSGAPAGDWRKISLYLPRLHGPSDATRGGGGGGDRSQTPASRGSLPKFSVIQFAPPKAVPVASNPLLPVPASLLGPPELTLPQMKENNMLWGDPQGVLAPRSSGPGGAMTESEPATTAESGLTKGRAMGLAGMVGAAKVSSASVTASPPRPPPIGPIPRIPKRLAKQNTWAR